MPESGERPFLKGTTKVFSASMNINAIFSPYVLEYSVAFSTYLILSFMYLFGPNPLWSSWIKSGIFLGLLFTSGFSCFHHASQSCFLFHHAFPLTSTFHVHWVFFFHSALIFVHLALRLLSFHCLPSFFWKWFCGSFYPCLSLKWKIIQKYTLSLNFFNTFSYPSEAIPPLSTTRFFLPLCTFCLILK